MRSVPLPIDAIQRGSRDAELLRAVEETYAALDARIAARRPTCINRGACCHFESFGHQLFVTPVELAYFLSTIDPPLKASADRNACPYQIRGTCTARQGRPGGCRVFFCDPRAQHWQNDESERLLSDLGKLHERYNLPYAYVEWTDALRQMALGGESGGPIAPADAHPGQLDGGKSAL